MQINSERIQKTQKFMQEQGMIGIMVMIMMIISISLVIRESSPGRSFLQLGIRFSSVLRLKWMRSVQL